jgi:monovalent cation:H+ antiporter-2, CPA2 family
MLNHMIVLVTVIFGGAIVVIALCKKLGVPPVIGFILTGLALGPFTAKFLPVPGKAIALSELGVVFLLFMVGLDFTPARMRRLGRMISIGGSVQAGLTILLSIAVGFLIDLSLAKSLLISFIVIQSSTAIALKVYQDRGELNSPHAELSTGIALFQDISAVLLLILIPLLSGGGHVDGKESLLIAGRNLLLLSGFAAAAYFLLPLILRFVIGTGIRELIVLLALVLCLGFAGLAQSLGFSLALGSFLCGMLLSKSEFHAQITAETAPFRDVFLSLFFISLGMGYDWPFALRHAGPIALLTIAIILVKTGILFLSSKALRFPFRTSLLAGIGLANVGEFGFVIMLAGIPYGLISQDEYHLIGSAAIYSMLLTPFILGGVSRAVLNRYGAGGRAAVRRPDEAMETKVVIVGFGLAGRHLARVLKTVMIPYSIIECNGQIVREALAQGEPMLFGDAARREILELGGVKSAQAIVFLIGDPAARATAIRMVKLINPSVTILCRTRRMIEIEPLLSAGANEVISEEFETSIELFTMVLTQLHVPRNIIRAQTRLLREDGYEMLRVPAPVQGISDKLMQVLAAGTTDVFQVMDGHFADGKSLRDLALRTATGATVIAVVRDDKSITNPPPDFTVCQGDALVIVGSHAQIEATFNYLETNGNNKQ